MSEPGPGYQPNNPATALPYANALGSRAAKLLGFTVAGVALVLLADVAPQAAIGITVALALGIVITHTAELQGMTNAFITATGGTPDQTVISSGGTAHGVK